MAFLTNNALRLLNWLNIYQITPTQYDYNLTYKYRATRRRGIFKTSLEELLSYGY